MQTALTPPITELRTRSWIYLGLALAMSGTAYWGFAYTYFTPVLAGTYPAVSPAVHVHGWSFFLWFLLLPFQALLMVTGRRRTHRLISHPTALQRERCARCLRNSGLHRLLSPEVLCSSAVFD